MMKIKEIKKAHKYKKRKILKNRDLNQFQKQNKNNGQEPDQDRIKDIVDNKIILGQGLIQTVEKNRDQDLIKEENKMKIIRNKIQIK